VPVETVLAASLAPIVVEMVLKFLGSREDTSNMVEKVAASSAGAGAVVLFAKWLSTKFSAAQTESVLPAIDSVPIDKADEVLCSLAVSTRLTGVAPGANVKVSSDGTIDLVSPQRRVGLGQTRVNGISEPILLVSAPDPLPNWVIKDLSVVPRSVVVGQMSAPVLREAGKLSATVPLDQHRPGRSVAHQDYFAGSLGAYVNWPNDKGIHVPAFVSACHVLSGLGRADAQNNVILSPGPPDAGRDPGRYSYGKVMRWERLVHHTDVTDPDNVINDVDIGLAYLIDSGTKPRNLVPDPNNPQEFLEVTDVLSLVELGDHSGGGEVFMVGRSTPFARGRLIATDVETFPIRMPNGKNYLFAGLALVESTSKDRRFSQEGDSGAIVYTVQDGRCAAAGFVVGGSEGHTFIAPAKPCLDKVGATLWFANDLRTT
jgi:hypothetical protein